MFSQEQREKTDATKFIVSVLTWPYSLLFLLLIIVIGFPVAMSIIMNDPTLVQDEKVLNKLTSSVMKSLRLPVSLMSGLVLLIIFWGMYYAS